MLEREALRFFMTKNFIFPRLGNYLLSTLARSPKISELKYRKALIFARHISITVSTILTIVIKITITLTMVHTVVLSALLMSISVSYSFTIPRKIVKKQVDNRHSIRGPLNTDSYANPCITTEWWQYNHFELFIVWKRGSKQLMLLALKSLKQPDRFEE